MCLLVGIAAKNNLCMHIYMVCYSQYFSELERTHRLTHTQQDVALEEYYWL